MYTGYSFAEVSGGSLFTLFSVKVHIVCVPARGLLGESLAAKGLTISAMAKTDGHIHLLGLTERKGYDTEIDQNE